MVELATLRLQQETRPFYRLSNGAYQKEHTFLDFVINDVSLWALTKQEDLDLVSCLLLPTPEKERVQRLLLQADADLPNNRRSLYLCGECCSDLYCGELTIVIEMTDNIIVWRDFGYEDFVQEPWSLESFSSFDPLVFDRQTYEALLLPLLDLSM